MKLRVSYAKRRYKDKVYVTPLLVYFYRDEKGVPRNRTVFNLSILPPSAITALEKALRSPSSSFFSPHMGYSQYNLSYILYTKSMSRLYGSQYTVPSY